ncbi:hypothetical protein [Nocardia sp. NPDC057272]|uniref:hypothetical protein n=1 Tax=Nocardia sp. NPDC057272 TaxID=3346079 RepID=UPI0036386F13
MQREHEEAMRADFDRHADLSDQMETGVTHPDSTMTDEQILAIDAQQQELEQRWAGGPHAEHWQYLSDAHDDWRQAPDTMRRMHENIAHNDGCFVTDIESRSQDQAASLYARTCERREAVQSEIRTRREATKKTRPQRARGTAERSR